MGRTHLAHKAEQAVDLDTGAIVGVTVQGADTGDTTTLVETLITAAAQVEAVQPDGPGIEEVVGDKGYHSNETLVDLQAVGLRTYLSKPDRGRRCWQGRPAARDAVYANRRRIRGARGRRLLRCRGELLERPFAHLFETGGMRRVHLRGHPNILKRLLVHVGRLQPRAAPAAPDRRRHAPEPSGPGRGPILRPDQAVVRPVGPSGALLDASSPDVVANGVVTAPSDLPAIPFERGHFCHGLVGLRHADGRGNSALGNVQQGNRSRDTVGGLRGAKNGKLALGEHPRPQGYVRSYRAVPQHTDSGTGTRRSSTARSIG